MIKLSNGHCLEYIAASGALGFDGKGWFWERPLKWLKLLDPSLFTVVIKTLTLHPRKGNSPFKSVRLVRQGIVNAVGLKNLGIEWWSREIGPKVKQDGIYLIGSIFSLNVENLVEMAEKLSEFNLVALEINASCPNSKNGMMDSGMIMKTCQEIKKKSRLPLILKLSVIHKIEILPFLEGIVEAISVNSVPWGIVFPNKRSPLAHLGNGGISGKIAQPFVWDFLRRLVEKIPDKRLGYFT